MKDQEVFDPKWPDGLEPNTHYKLLCDDKGQNGGTWLSIFISNDGDAYVSMQDWEDIPNGIPRSFPSLRVRTLMGGGHNLRTRQALLWLADAIRRDNAEVTNTGR